MLEIFLRGRVPLIFINTIEIDRAIYEVKKSVKAIKESIEDVSFSGKIFTLTAEGLVGDDGRVLTPSIDIIEVLEYIKGHDSDDIFIIPTYLFMFDDSYVSSRVITYLKDLKDKYIIGVGDTSKVPQEIQVISALYELKRPSKNEIFKYLRVKIPEWIGRKVKDDALDKVCNVLSGLTITEIDLIMKSNFILTNGKKIKFDYLFEEKANLVKKTGLLEIIKTDDGIDSVGGLEELKQWANTVKYIYQNIDKALKFGLDIPKGTLITGVSGCGKSLFAKAIANNMGLPLFRLDIGRLMGSLVGETERNTRELFKIIESVSPCVVLVDEIEKMLSGIRSGGRNDGGVVERLFGNLLYYMEERRDRAFFIATANDISGLPPELLRKGRWDEIWFVDIPNDNERVQILKIHIEKSGRKFENVFKSKNFIKEFINVSKDFTGAEIEQVVKDTLREAFVNKKELTAKDIILNCNKVKPLIKMNSSQYTSLRKWAINNCRIANSLTEKISGKLLNK